MFNFKNLFNASMVLLMSVAALGVAAGYDKSHTDGMKSDFHKEKMSDWGEKKNWDYADQAMAVEVDIEKDNLDLTNKADPKIDFLEIAVLGTADFDVNTIDQKSLAIGDVKGSGEYTVADRNNDGIDDLVAEFTVADLDLKQGSQELTLKGKTKDGKMFKGSDQITVTKAE